jgi:hypothetical protein
VHFVAVETQQHRQRFASILIVVGDENAPQSGCGDFGLGESSILDLHRAAD